VTVNEALFFGSGLLSIATTIMVIASRNPVNAVLYLIMSLFGVSVVFYTLGTSFLAALEVIIYAGAIMVLFLFVVMILNLGELKTETDLQPPTAANVIIPGFFAGLLLLLTIAVLLVDPTQNSVMKMGSMRELALQLYQKHYLGVELASLVLLIGIIGGMHLGRAAHYDSDTPEVTPRADS
jgi:NADH-quinone oxidoreductase subunit J